MAMQRPGGPSHQKDVGDATSAYLLQELPSYKPKWYFTKEEIEELSPSRKDGIDSKTESHLRQLYCSYLLELGMELKVPQVTIATAMMFCHRFYMYQSHAKNHWQTVASSSMFLACKAEDTPRWLKDFVTMSYKLMYRWDPLASQKIRQTEVYDNQKRLILLGERLILATIAFDFNIEHPYKPLVAGLKMLEITEKEVLKVAWNFVNDWMRTTLCLQYKPHYIAAGSIYLAAKCHKIILPSGNGKIWWMQFDVSPKKLEEVIHHMLQLHRQSNTQKGPGSVEAKTKTKLLSQKSRSDSTDSCISSSSLDQNHSSEKQVVQSRILSPTDITHNRKEAHNDSMQIADTCQVSTSGSASNIVEDGAGKLITEDSDQNSGIKIAPVTEIFQKIDVKGIRERIKKRKLNAVENKKPTDNLEDEISSEGWIARELEKGIELVAALS